MRRRTRKRRSDEKATKLEGEREREREKGRGCWEEEGRRKGNLKRSPDITKFFEIISLLEIHDKSTNYRGMLQGMQHDIISQFFR